jgi:hypothetical protein
LNFLPSLLFLATIKSEGDYEPLDELAETTLLADLGAADHHWPGSDRSFLLIVLDEKNGRIFIMNEDSVAKTPLQWELNRPSFYRELTERFDLNEIKLLCAELDIKYEELDGTTLSTKAVALFDYFERSQTLEELFKACQRVRPNTSWWGFLQSVSTPSSSTPTDSGHPRPLLRRNWWSVVGLLLILAISIGLGWLWGNRRNTGTNNASVPTFANIKERFDFEVDAFEALKFDWQLATCPSLDTTKCGWLNADDKLSLAQIGFSGEKSLQVEVELVNVEQIYTTEHCFDPTILDGISASIFVPVRESNEQTLAATKIYLLARPQGDDNVTQQWPTSILELDESFQPGWYQIFLDLSQVANESREPFNALLVDCVHIDLILPATPQNEKAIFLIDDVAFYRNISSHSLITNIPPEGLISALTDVQTPLGKGLVFNFEDNAIDETFWTAEDTPVYVSRNRAYDGIFSMAIDAHLEEHEGFSGTENACITLQSIKNAQGYSLKNQIVISRIYVPDDVPDNLKVQFHLIDSHFWPTYGDILAGQWNTFVWYTADAPELEQESDLEICLILRDRDAGDGSKNAYDGTFYLDKVELFPYRYTYNENGP